ncbi:MAG: zinc ribbon domain-containing protein [Armatimonadetes bacterium]|nr:zinc ribbon domain-containing protein [Armatimonadota bacterium]
MERSQHDAAAPAADTPDTGSEPIICYACGTELPEGRRHCPECGRSQLRTCYCGNNIPVTVRTCPYCGADWSQSARVRKRKSRSHRASSAQVASYALAGALVALMTAVVANLVIGSFARRSLAPGEPLPASFSERMVLAAQTVLKMGGRIREFATTHGGSLLGFMLILLAGAAAGALYYFLTVSDHRGTHSGRSRRSNNASSRDRQIVRVRRRRA